MNIAFIGDLAALSPGTLDLDWKNKLNSVSKYLERFDVVVANLEVPITTECKTRVIKGIHLKTKNDIVDLLNYLNITHVNLANNHIYDYGKIGLEHTIEALEKGNIKYFGIKEKPYIELEQGNIVLRGYCCYSTNAGGYYDGHNKGSIIALKKDTILADLEEDAKHRRFSILSFHWGEEYSPYPSIKQCNFVHELADKYRILVQGHHTHVMQGIEKYKDSWICYGQGNFCMDDCESEVNPKLKIKLSDICRESFILETSIKEGNIYNISTTGIYNSISELKIIDNTSRISELSAEINRYHSFEYNQKKQEAIAKNRISVLGQKDLTWFWGKLNINSILAKLLSYYNRIRYYRAIK